MKEPEQREYLVQAYGKMLELCYELLSAPPPATSTEIIAYGTTPRGLLDCWLMLTPDKSLVAALHCIGTHAMRYDELRDQYIMPVVTVRHSILH